LKFLDKIPGEFNPVKLSIIFIDRTAAPLFFPPDYGKDQKKNGIFATPIIQSKALKR
jgi:hypothetical protein